MATSVVLSPQPILQFFNNAGFPAAGGSLLTQVGGVNYATYQDSAGATPLPNPIPLNSRGEISNAAGASCQLFLTAGVVYTFTLSDSNGNLINSATYVADAGYNAVSQLSGASGAGMIGYLSPYSTAVLINLQNALQSFIQTPSMYGADPTGVTDSTTALNNFIANVPNPIIQGTFLLSGVLLISNTGNNKHIGLQNATLNYNYPSGASLGAIECDGVGSGFRLLGDKLSRIVYTNAPTARTSQAILIQGASITDCEIGGFTVVNSPNMNVAVFCGLSGTVASGSSNIRIHDIEVQNSLGDGIHVQNADSDVKIWDITGTGTGDDGIAVINYTGTGNATHPTQTNNVRIWGINLTQCHTSIVAFAGVNDYDVKASGTSYPGASAIAFKCTASANYVVGNSNGFFDIVGDSFSKMAAFDTPGAVSPTAGCNFNRDHHGRVKGTNVTNTGVYMSNAGTGGDGMLARINVDMDISASVDMINGVYIGNTTDCSIGEGQFVSISNIGLIANNSGFRWRKFVFRTPSATSTYGAQIVGNTNIYPGIIDMSDTKATPTLQTGVQFQSNTGVFHEGEWRVQNAVTAAFLFGSNSGVRGFFYSTSFNYIGSGATSGANTTATAGTNTTITFPDAIPTGAGSTVEVTVNNATGSPATYSTKSSTGIVMVWGNNLTGLNTAVDVKMFSA